ncbi:MEKHLA domain-containing protein [Actinoplanes couchii]|uniref:MEKHLA domain-containing protein n=1 Tax=Actinoplanes couchii TaxID=403638 RepID=A0ABQ3XNW4_9ACTN|nr:MEKHLA domain-containing protein [Actinoplanes couchii]MDR6319606.1 PAS domain S-box-containing protein [Actinoplanes couchii]GID60171.1 MEKHLA domain-containing protein [Actinoplanes couchii]
MTGVPDAALAADSYLKLTGRPLLPEDKTATWLYDAPFGLLVHDASADPLFVYANRTAQQMFGYRWDEFVGLPSRLSAGAQDREERRVFMESVLRDGYADDYRGTRIRKDGHQFQLLEATVWNVLADDATVIGQAAAIWRWGDS